MYKEHNLLSTQNLQAMDAAHHLHPFSEMGQINAKGSRIITRGEGVYIWDSEGNKILDGMSGLWCTQIGNGRKEIADAILAQMNEISYYNCFFQCSHPAATQLSAVLAEVSPAGFEHVFFTNSGSEANDTVYRMVRSYWNAMGKPNKKIILTRTNAYHGSTVLAANLGGMSAMHAQGGKEIDSIHHIAQPYWYGSDTDLSPDDFGIEAANALEAAILEHGEDNVAAFIAEPIQGAGGAIIPPETYWPRVQEILDKYDILFSADEVICGFGRTGEWFGSDYFGIKPDFMTIAKGVTSGYVPMGGVLVGSRVAPVIANE
ncbi:MAG: aminotransferase class III-fold pyridoxal phosphate-dependent enzyme, partial [Alphaproteobacteria bacterium]